MEQYNLPLRKELKFLLDRHEYTLLQLRLEKALQRDRHGDKQGHYLVSSLYYDTPQGTAFAEKIAGVGNRKKYRIRTYNNNPEIIKLEVKGKHADRVFKYYRFLTVEELARLTAGDVDFLLHDGSRAGVDFFAGIRRNLLCPSVIVSYTRQAYTFPADEIRINFDYGLHHHGTDKDLLESASNIALLTGRFIFEIKYNTYLPPHIRDLVQLESKVRQPLSKFEFARRRKF